ncbi:integrase [Aquitalea sp. FJL05]|uniref:phage integrase central domain-containing protein n=1 Tax=Aquitalea sp. FJL05 TaxID=2153366 RepID=UPI000F5B7E4D|nr:tyrosine-type recombinase/integrase [Aquitalea sp. FJL05]RQO65751.1 integrase [Aquitalea sp. FJL05]
MPKKAKELSALAVSRLKENGKHAVGGVDGLYLRIAGNSRAWVLCAAMGSRINQSGKEVVRRLSIGLGPFPEISLAEAREKARTLRKKIRDGIDPLQEKRKAKLTSSKSKTFEQCALAFIEDKKIEWRNDKHVKQWSSTLTTYAFPLIGQFPINAIDNDAILLVLRQEVSSKDGSTSSLWNARNETASRLRGRLESILDWAKVSGYREGENPAAWQGNLKHVLPAPGKIQKVEHHAALPFSEIGTFMEKLRERSSISAKALEFAILTAARSGEVRGATWDEVDLHNKTWTISAERMKASKSHTVPLSDSAYMLLKNMPKIVGNSLIFPAPKGGIMSDQAFKALFDRMQVANITTHGFRSTFKDWARSCKGTEFSDEVSELALAHVNNDQTRAAYARDQLLPQRMQLMQEWAIYCNIKTTRIIPIKAHTA